MNRRSIAGFIVIACTLLYSACDTGLAPLTERDTGFSGVIHFKNWPLSGTLKELRLVAFKKYPSDSTYILLAVAQGQVVVYPRIGTTGLNYDSLKTNLADSLRFEITTNGTTLEPINYEYVALALRYGNNVLTDWRPAGVYTTTPGSFNPAPVRVLLHRIVPDINIEVDFRNPPPRPWR